MLPNLANGVVKVAFSDATIPSQRVADVTLKKQKIEAKFKWGSDRILDTK